MRKPTNIVHLTDLHFSARDQHNQAIVIDALVEDLKRSHDKRLSPDAVLFSGDLVQNPDEPDVYMRLLDDVILPVLAAANCTESRLVITPGNHDVHRSAVETQRPYFDGVLGPGCDRDAINAEYAQGGCRDLFEKRFAGFLALREAVNVNRQQLLSNAYASGFVLPDVPVAFAELNTAFASTAGLWGSD